MTYNHARDVVALYHACPGIDPDKLTCDQFASFIAVSPRHDQEIISVLRAGLKIEGPSSGDMDALGDLERQMEIEEAAKIVHSNDNS